MSGDLVRKAEETRETQVSRELELLAIEIGSLEEHIIELKKRLASVLYDVEKDEALLEDDTKIRPRLVPLAETLNTYRASINTLKHQIEDMIGSLEL